MAERSGAHLAPSACVPCKQHKRKCNRALPSCETCDRVGRSCAYPGDPGGPASPRRLDRIAFNIPSMINVDPYSHASLRQPFIDIALRDEAFNIMGDLPEAREMVHQYFSTISPRLPILSPTRFLAQLPDVYTRPRAGYSILYLSICLLVQKPLSLEFSTGSLQSSLYVTLKCLIASLEATNESSLSFIQARILVCYYELGHAIYPAASSSIAACTRTARAFGLELKDFQTIGRDYSTLTARLAAEEEKRTWWAIINLDRFINLCTGDSAFAAREPSSTDILPIGDIQWAQGAYPEAEVNALNLQTSQDLHVGPFARECQVFYLVGRVVRNVFEPSSDVQFNHEEAVQLERTLNAYLPLLDVAQETSGLYCAAFGLCCSALFVMYDAALRSPLYLAKDRSELSQSIEDISSRLALFVQAIFAKPSSPHANGDLLSPFTCYPIYQGIIVQQRLFKRNGHASHNIASTALRAVLERFKTRWHVADLYLRQLDLLADWTKEPPSTIHFICQGKPMSASGPKINTPFSHPI